MNRFLASILFTFSLLVLSFQLRADTLDDIAAFIKAGNSTEITKLMAPSVDMSVLSEEGTYNKAQADAQLKDFFKKHPPSSAKIIHKLTSNPNYLFAVILVNTTGGVYRTSVSMKNTSGKFLITEIRFEINKD